MCNVKNKLAESEGQTLMKSQKKIYFPLFYFLFGLCPTLLMDEYKFVENQIKFNTRKIIKKKKKLYSNVGWMIKKKAHSVCCLWAMVTICCFLFLLFFCKAKIIFTPVNFIFCTYLLILIIIIII